MQSVFQFSYVVQHILSSGYSAAPARRMDSVRERDVATADCGRQQNSETREGKL